MIILAVPGFIIFVAGVLLVPAFGDAAGIIAASGAALMLFACTA